MYSPMTLVSGLLQSVSIRFPVETGLVALRRHGNLSLCRVRASADDAVR